MNRSTLERLAKRLARFQLRKPRPNQVYSPLLDLAGSLIFLMIGIFDGTVLPFAIAIFLLITGGLRFQIAGLVLLLNQPQRDTSE